MESNGRKEINNNQNQGPNISTFIVHGKNCDDISCIVNVVTGGNTAILDNKTLSSSSNTTLKITPKSPLNDL